VVETVGVPLDVDANATIAIGIAAHAAAQIQIERLHPKITRGWTGLGT